MKKIKLAICSFFLGFCVLLLAACNTTVTNDDGDVLRLYKRNYEYFDTLISLSIYSTNYEKANAAFEYASKTFKLYDILLNRYEEESSITMMVEGVSTSIQPVGVYTLNQKAGEKTIVTKEFYDCLKYATDEGLKICDEDGIPYFTSAIGPINDIWHDLIAKYGKGTYTDSEKILPSEEVLNAQYNTDASKIIFYEEETAILIEEDMGIDLGGIAKGYVSEIITTYYEENNISYILNLGSSNIKTNIGNPQREDNAYIVGLTKPKADAILDETYASISLPINYSIITSGNYQRSFVKNGTIYCHILDSRTASPTTSDIQAVSIVMKDGALGDIYSTAVFLMGLEKGYAFINSIEDVEAVFYTMDDEVYATPGMVDILTLNSGYELKIMMFD